jgi:uncharacterized protein (TIGR00369 family)
MQVPNGYIPLPLGPDFNGHLGPFYGAAFPDGIRLGTRLLEHHLNAFGTAHGGAIAAIADLTGLLVQQMSGHTDRATLTVSLTIQYLDRSFHGEWMNLRPTLLGATKSLLFTKSGVYADDRLVAQSTAIFRIGSVTKVPFATLGHFFADNFPGSVPEPLTV